MKKRVEKEEEKEKEKKKKEEKIQERKKNTEGARCKNPLPAVKYRSALKRIKTQASLFASRSYDG